MQNLRIATWNISSKNFNIKRNKNKANAVISLLTENNLDILSLQGVNSIVIKEITKKLNEQYEYEITSTHKKVYNPLKRLEVRYNVIISRLNPLSASHTESLSDTSGFKLVRPSKTTLVHQILSDDIIVNNTQLESNQNNQKQVEKILRIVDKQDIFDYQTFLTGSINCKDVNEEAMSILYKLSEIGIETIQINYDEKTKKKSIECIIIPSDFELENIEVLKDYSDVIPNEPLVINATRSKEKVLNFTI